jgi:serine/threonine-protein phosphatase 2A regulatory subunit B''
MAASTAAGAEAPTAANGGSSPGGHHHHPHHAHGGAGGPVYPCAKLKLDQLFLQWLSLPESQRLVAQLVDDARQGKALSEPAAGAGAAGSVPGSGAGGPHPHHAHHPHAHGGAQHLLHHPAGLHLHVNGASGAAAAHGVGGAPLSPSAAHAIFASMPPLSPRKGGALATGSGLGSPRSPGGSARAAAAAAAAAVAGGAFGAALALQQQQQQQQNQQPTTPVAGLAAAAASPFYQQQAQQQQQPSAAKGVGAQQLIPRFYIPPAERAASEADAAARAEFLARVDALFDPHEAEQGGLNLEQFSRVVQEVCQLPTIVAHQWCERLAAAADEAEGGGGGDGKAAAAAAEAAAEGSGGGGAAMDADETGAAAPPAGGEAAAAAAAGGEGEAAATTPAAKPADGAVSPPDAAQQDQKPRAATGGDAAASAGGADTEQKKKQQEQQQQGDDATAAATAAKEEGEAAGEDGGDGNGSPKAANAEGGEEDGAAAPPPSPPRLVRKQVFVDWWLSRGLLTAPPTKRLWAVLARDGADGLTPDDFRPLMAAVLQYHPGLEFLADTPEFQARYAETCVCRIFYSVNRSGSGRISYRELRRSDLLEQLFALEREEDINRLTRYFSYEHFYVVYCKFWELDSDHDFALDRADLARYGGCALSYRAVDRVFEQAPRRFCGSAPQGQMGYEDFVWFILSEEDKSSDAALEYWFRAADLDGDGALSPSEMWHFYEEQMRRLEAMSQEPVLFEDVLCQLHDMLQPEREGAYTLKDLRRSRPASALLFNALFNLHKFLAFENRDPFALRAEALAEEAAAASSGGGGGGSGNGGVSAGSTGGSTTSSCGGGSPAPSGPTEWDRFARVEYLRLAVEDDPDAGGVVVGGGPGDGDGDGDGVGGMGGLGGLVGGDGGGSMDVDGGSAAGLLGGGGPGAGAGGGAAAGGSSDDDDGMTWAAGGGGGGGDA